MVMKLKEEEIMKKVGFNIELDDWEEFKKLAKQNNSDTNKELRKFIKEYIEKNKKQRKERV